MFELVSFTLGKDLGRCFERIWKRLVINCLSPRSLA